MFGNLCNIQLSTHYCSYTVCLKEVLNLCTDVRLLCACDRGYKRWVPLIRTSRWEDTASSSASLRKLQGKPTFLSVTTKVTHEVLSQNTNVLNVDVLVSHSLFFLYKPWLYRNTNTVFSCQSFIHSESVKTNNPRSLSSGLLFTIFKSKCYPLSSIFFKESLT